MNIIEALKKKGPAVYLAYGDRWMEWCEPVKVWVVCKREYGQTIQQLYITEDEEQAIEYLLYRGDD